MTTTAMGAAPVPRPVELNLVGCIVTDCVRTASMSCR